MPRPLIDANSKENVGPGRGINLVLEPAAIGVGIGAVLAACWLFVVGGGGLLELAAFSCALGGIGLAVGFLRLPGDGGLVGGQKRAHGAAEFVTFANALSEEDDTVR